MTEERTTHNGLLNVSFERWVGVIQSLGIPTIFMMFILWLAYQHIPPVVQAHIHMLERTSESLNVMSETLDQMKDSQYEQQKLMQQMCDRLSKETS